MIDHDENLRYFGPQLSQGATILVASDANCPKCSEMLVVKVTQEKSVEHCINERCVNYKTTCPFGARH